MVLAQSVVFAWVYNSTRGSVLLVILMHGASNTIIKFLGSTLIGSAAFGLFWWLLAALWWVGALTAIAVFGMARDRAPSLEAAETATSSVRAQPSAQ
jgi:hypothetical protein